MIDDGPAARFWARVDRSGGPNACWPWTGGRIIKGSGYGQFILHGKHTTAHRAAFELTYGAVLPGMQVCHTCDNPPCCNPKHLWVGTPADNMTDRIRKGRGSKRGRQAYDGSF